MGHTTSISDYELGRGDGPPPCEGVDIEAPVGKPGKPPGQAVGPKSKTAKPEPEAVEEEVGWEDYTVAELKDELDALGVDYPSTARKAELIELVEQAGDD